MQECDWSTSLRASTRIIWAPPSHSQVPKQCPAQGKSRKSSCWVYRLRTVAKVRGWHTAFPDDYFWSREFFCFIQSVSTYVSSDSSVSFFSLLNQDLHWELSLTLLLNHHHLKISTDEILFASPKHLHCNGEGGIKSKPFSQQWPGGGTPSAWHSCLLGGSWEKVVLSF